MTSVALRRVASYSETTATTTTPTPTKTKRYTILRRRKRADEGERAPWESPVISHPISSTSSTPTVSTPNRSFLNPNPDPVARAFLMVIAEKAFGEDGNLKQPKELSINKVGHGLSPSCDT
ncbi:hypothetical protein BHM03_00034342 [Ensete ventricosum]|nr:hypothetical protein BHM03_00034342 [Ensete ventricosum]